MRCRVPRRVDACSRSAALLVGMDTPQLKPHQLLGFDPVRHEAAVGLAPDGGFWALGLRDARRARAAVVGVPMSRANTGAAQYAALQVEGLHPVLLDTLCDIDTVDDLLAVVADAPPGRLRSVVAELGPDLVGRVG